MKAERILARLNAFHSLLKYRVERIADARQPRTQELSLSLILTDVDAAINDIRGMLAEPVTVEDANKRIVKEILSFDVECD